MASIDTLIAIQGSDTVSALQLNLPLETTWETFVDSIAEASGIPRPFVLSSISDSGEETVIGSEGEFELLKVTASSYGGHLVMTLAAAPEPEVSLPEEKVPEPEPKAEEKHCPRGRCPRSNAGAPFGFGGLLQGLMGNFGLAQGDLPNIAKSFMSGEPMPQEEMAKIADLIGAMTGQDASVIKSNMAEAFNHGQEVVSQLQKTAEQEKEKEKEAAPVPSTTPVSTPTTPPARHNAICDACDVRIVGLRFKCLNCDDYDLCEPCESDNFVNGTHDPTHVFAKIYEPLPFMSGFKPMANLYAPAGRPYRRISRGCHPRFMQHIATLKQMEQDKKNEAEAERQRFAAEEERKKVVEERRVIAEQRKAIVEQRRKDAEKRHAEARQKAAASMAARKAARDAQMAKQNARNQQDDKLSALEKQLQDLALAIAEERASRNA